MLNYVFMTHRRERQLLEAFKKLTAFSPIVGLFGHRQVGKTTFLETQANEYISLDDPEVQNQAQSSPNKFLQDLSGDGSALDECQLAPALFPALKLRVQKNKRPGQFYLSGSVRFTSRSVIRESLTGRVASVEMFPFVCSEIVQERLSHFAPQLIKARSLAGFTSSIRLPAGVHSKRMSAFQTYLTMGGLPGICFVRENPVRKRMLEDLLKTMLDRDLRLVVATPLSLSELIDYCRELALGAFQPVRYADLHRKTGLNPRTLKRLLAAFESIYLIRRLPIEGGGASGEIVLFEDQIEQNFLSGETSSFEVSRSGALYRNLRAQFEYRLGSTPQFFTYMTRGGARVPLALRTELGVAGFYPIEQESFINRPVQASIDSFLKSYERARVVIVNEGSKDIKLLSPRVLMAPPSAILF